MKPYLILLFASALGAQTKLLQPYLAPELPPARLANSARAGTLIRSGKLYITLKDAIALAIENDLGLEVNRYGPLLSEWALKRAEAGGPVRGVPSASAQVSSVNSGVGVNGSAASAGLGGGGGGSSSSGGGGASIQQIGQVTPNLDPIFQNTTTFSHQTQPQANTILSQTNALVATQRAYNTTYQQGLLSGGTIQLRAYDQYFRENSPSDALNPAYGPHADIAFRHNLLQGFGTRLNGRSIRIAQLNIVTAKETFRSDVAELVSAVTNLYWDLVSAMEILKVRESAVGIAAQFLQDTQSRIAAGALARIELPRAQAELAGRRQDLLIAQATVRQLENRLKASFARTDDPLLDAAEIAPLDSLQAPDSRELPPTPELVASAMKKRPDMAISKIRDAAALLNAAGTQNPLLPNLSVNLQASNRGAAGTAQTSGGTANPYFTGGAGKAIGQILRRDFPSESAAISLSAPLGNREAQADYGIDQLQLQQAAVRGKRDRNQIAVDISNNVIALRQARARYQTAVTTRELQQELLKGEQEKFSFGRASITGLITSQRALVAAQTAEIAALASCVHARVSLDEVLGETLDANHISIDKSMAGQL